MPVRRLQNFIYCPRLFYLQWVEGIFEENADTVAGAHVHRNVETPTRLEDSGGIQLAPGARIRTLRLESESLGLVGVIDVIEEGPEGVQVVDYKKGSARKEAEGGRVAKESDAIQVGAYALLARESGIPVRGAAIYYASDRHRVEVELTPELLDRVRSSIDQARALAASRRCPAPLKNDPRCLYCSAYPICLPRESLWWARREKSDATTGQLLFDFAKDMDSEIDRRVREAMESASESEGAPDLAGQPPRPPGDEGEILVVQTPGAQVGQRGEELVVSVKGETLRKLPGRQVRSIYLYGAVQLTSQAALSCLEQGIDVSFFSPAGRFLGLLHGLPTSGIDARRGQYRLFELEEVRLRLAREVIRAKIHNQRVMIMRNGEPDERVLSMMADFRDQAAQAWDREELLGLEGAAASLYFQQFGSMLKKECWGSFDWRGRNRRPPRDPVNALLSLGYSMLAKELTGVLFSVGVDPFFGFLHQPRYGRPALALDLMEEFRPLIADSVAISLVNRGELSGSDFVRGANGTFLNERGRRAFWEAYFRRMDTEVTHPEFGYRMSYRRMLEVQARQLWRFLRGEAAHYRGFTTR